MSTQDLILKDTPPELQGRLSMLELSVRGLVVNDDVTYQAGIDLGRTIKDAAAAADSYFRPDIKRAHEIWKSLTGKLKVFTDKYDDLFAIVNKRLVAWVKEQDEIKRRAERELADQADELRRQKLQEARLALRQGQVAVADQLQEEAQSVVAPTLPSLVPKVEGAYEVDRWTGECIDPMDLLQAVASGKIKPIHTIPGARRDTEVVEPVFIVNPKVLNYYAGMLKENFKWPGCRAVKTTNVTIRR